MGAHVGHDSAVRLQTHDLVTVVVRKRRSTVPEPLSLLLVPGLPRGRYIGHPKLALRHEAWSGSLDT